jgi:hypothetical protein
VREPVDADRLRAFMRAAGREAEKEGVCYLTGGSLAVLEGWRDSTVDIDIRLEPEQDRLLRELQRIKHDLEVNVELASPIDFVPAPSGWEERSPLIAREGRLTFRHFDPSAQALAKIERGHDRDLVDVREMLERGIVEHETLRLLYDEIEPQLYRFPQLDAPSFRRRLERALASPS